MLSSNSRNSATGLGLAALSASLGLALNRLDVGIFGYFQDAGTVYFPSLIEWSVGLGVVAAAGLMFFFIAENFPIFDEQWQQQKVQTGVFKASFDKITHVWNTVLRDSLQRVSLILVFVIPIAWIMLYPPYVKSHSSAIKIHPPLAEDILRNVLKIDGNRDGLFTVFPHKEHQERLGGEESCRTCHHISMPEDKSSPCSRCHRDMVSQTLIFNHTYHLSAVVKEEKIGGLQPENYSCVVCHKKGQPRTAENAKACFECHEEDMHIVKDSVSLDVDLTRANSFMEAMHFNCIECHRKENNIANKPDLGECYTCHKSLKPNELALELRNIE
jgi:hypothetical protein